VTARLLKVMDHLASETRHASLPLFGSLSSGKIGAPLLSAPQKLIFGLASAGVIRLRTLIHSHTFLSVNS
jgi:hypothetical protein